VAQDQGWSSRVKAGGDLDEFRNAVQQTAASNLKSDALGDVKGLALAALGVGAAGRGAVGLYNMFKRNTRPRKPTAPSLSLPYPVAVAEKEARWLGRLLGRGSSAGARPLPPAAPRPAAATPRPAAGDVTTTSAHVPAPGGSRSALTPDAQVKQVSPQLHAWMHGGKRTWSGAGLAGLGTLGAAGAAKAASFLGGDHATSKAGIPWYGPAMMTAGLAGLAGGWKGVDHLLNKRRAREREKELGAARSEFHDALMAQYDRPLAGAGPTKAAADLSPMAKVGAELDTLYDQFEKAAFALNDTAGQLAGGYGVYAGLTGLMTGALVYDKARKRQRRAILEKAMQRRERRRFNVAPPEITAVPEPFHPAPPAAPDAN